MTPNVKQRNKVWQNMELSSVMQVILMWSQLQLLFRHSDCCKNTLVDA